MFKHLRRALDLGMKVARITKAEAKKEINAMVKAGIINKKEGKVLLGKIVNEAKQEKQRFQKFVAVELKKELAKAKPLMREFAKRGRKVAARAGPKIRSAAARAMSRAKQAAKKRAAKVKVRVKSIRKKKR